MMALSSSTSSFGAIRKSAMHTIDHLSPAPTTTNLDTPLTNITNNHYDDDDFVQQFRRGTSSAGNNNATSSYSDLLLMKMMAAGDLMHRPSACINAAAGRSCKRPPTPSPVCSPQSTADDPSLFATPKLSSCVAFDEIKQAEPRDVHPCDNDDGHKMLGEGEDISMLRRSLKSVQIQKAAVRYAEQERENSVGTSNYYGDDDAGRLQDVTEETLTEEPEKEAETRGYRYALHQQLSSGSGSYDGSDYGSTDIESLVEERIRSSVQGRRRPFQAGSAARSRKNELAAKLHAWKEARTMKIMNKLRMGEAAVDEWEKKKSTEARMEMNKLEAKLENKRTQAMQKMQMKIRRAQREAEKKKAKQRDAAGRKIADVAEVFHRAATTGKLSCWLLFL